METIQLNVKSSFNDHARAEFVSRWRCCHQ
jgi:hypothetical protein